LRGSRGEEENYNIILQRYGCPGEETSETSATPAPQTEPLASQAEPPREETRTEASKVILSRQKINGEVGEGKGKVPADVSDVADVGTPATVTNFLFHSFAS